MNEFEINIEYYFELRSEDDELGEIVESGFTTPNEAIEAMKKYPLKKGETLTLCSILDIIDGNETHSIQHNICSREDGFFGDIYEMSGDCINLL